MHHVGIAHGRIGTGMWRSLHAAYIVKGRYPVQM
jgi:hypothetical protein